MTKLSKSSHLEDKFLFHCQALKFPDPVREYVFAKPRRYRFDFAWPDKKVAVEIEGGTWGKSRHTTGKGYEGDCNKYNLACSLGWKVFRLTGDMVKNGEWLTEIRTAVSN